MNVINEQQIREMVQKINQCEAEIGKAIIGQKEIIRQTILAILADVDPAEYHCNGATVLVDLFEMLADTELMQLFGLQSKTQGPTCSGAQSENTEAPEQ